MKCPGEGGTPENEGSRQRHQLLCKAGMTFVRTIKGRRDGEMRPVGNGSIYLNSFVIKENSGVRYWVSNTKGQESSGGTTI